MTNLRVADGLTLRDTHCDKSDSCGWPDLKGHTLVTSLRVADGLTLMDTHCDKSETCGWPDLQNTRAFEHGREGKPLYQSKFDQYLE